MSRDEVVRQLADYAKDDPESVVIADWPEYVAHFALPMTTGQAGGCPRCAPLLIIRYLIANTRDWWFGRHVLLSPASVREILWDRQEIRLNLTGYKIKGSPAWEPTGLLDRAYEQLLQSHYGWPAAFLPTKQGAPSATTTDAPAREPVAL